MSVTLASSLSNPSSFSSQSCFSTFNTKINGTHCYNNRLSFPLSGAGAGNSFTVKSSSGGGGTAVMDRKKTSTTTSLYDLLRINSNASQTEIKTAYRSLAKVYHPDAGSESDDGHDFIEIHDEYATLSDPSARALYDISLSVGCDLMSRSSSTSPFSYASSRSSGYTTTRRWETDQCW